MTRKDYILIAAAIKAQADTYPGDMPRVNAIRATASRIAYAISLDNPRFNRDTFMVACGFTA